MNVFFSFSVALGEGQLTQPSGGNEAGLSRQENKSHII